MTTPTPAQRLLGKVSIITGAAQGIGLATALKFAREGAIVIVCDVKQSAVDAAVEQCRALGATAQGYVMDVTQRAVVDSVVQAVLAQHGRVDVLVNNAGITQDARLQKMTIEQFDKVIDVNLRGVFHCSQAVADAMVAQGSGAILNASSVVGVYGNFGQTNYAASKGGVIALTKALAKEVGSRGIRVNCVAPGYISTELTDVLPDEIRDVLLGQTPLGRLGEPDDIAGTVRFLLSDEAAFITGAVLSVDGGLGI